MVGSDNVDGKAMPMLMGGSDKVDEEAVLRLMGGNDNVDRKEYQSKWKAVTKCY
jgi:hypothetical protein